MTTSPSFRNDLGNLLSFSLSLVLTAILISCNTEKRQDSVTELNFGILSISSSAFGVTSGGDSVTQYTLTNQNGMEVRILNYGGIVTHMFVPDKEGVLEDVVLGFENLADYMEKSPYFGAIVGRYGNRIAKGKFTLNGKEYSLAVNNGPNHLHGGIKGFDKVVWSAESNKTDSTVALKLFYLSVDMEEGFPGNLSCYVTYTLNISNELRIDYEATTDKPTVVNLTQHTYFNLTGNTKTDILGHKVKIESKHILPVDGGLIPTGELLPVEGTPFDFNTEEIVGKRIDDDHPQIALGGGYDHCWVLDTNGDHQGLEWTMSARDTVSGRVLEVATTEPAVQFYTGNFMTGNFSGKYGTVYNKRYGLCFEPEHYPDSPNQSAFPSAVLNPGEKYQTTTIWRFSIAAQ